MGKQKKPHYYSGLYISSGGIIGEFYQGNIKKFEVLLVYKIRQLGECEGVIQLGMV